MHGACVATTQRIVFLSILLFLNLTLPVPSPSVIPKVIPYCIVNAIWAGVIYELKTRGIIDLTSSPSGHKYLAVIMSFLLVSRVKVRRVSVIPIKPCWCLYLSL